MLIQIGNVIFDTADVKLVSIKDDNTATVHLSTVENGRRLTLTPDLTERLNLFLRASGLIDLNGPAFNRPAFEAAAGLHEELQARQTIRTVFSLNEQKNAADAALNAIAAVNSPAREAAPAGTVTTPTAPPQPPGPTLVPRPAPPALPTSSDEDPDPMLFIPKSPRRLTPSILDGL